MQNHNLNRRIGKIEDRCGIAKNDEIVEIPLENGQVYRSTKRKLNEFIEWLENRANNGQETITTT